MKEQIELMRVVFDFLDHLSEEQLKMLVYKKAKLRLEIEREIVTETVTQICIDEICDEIENFTTREEAIEYISKLSLLKVELKAIAKKYNIPVGSKETNTQIIGKIVENLVGSKLRFDALLNTDLKN